MLNEIIDKLEKRIYEYFKTDGTGHDIYHLKRTMNVALKIQEKEGGDRLVIGIAAFLHDVHRIMAKEQGKVVMPSESLDICKFLLQDLMLTIKQVNNILHCIEHHEEYGFTKTGRRVNDIETLIIQDADNIDAIGAIGIARVFTFNGAHGLPIYNPNIPIGFKVFEEEHYDPSAIHNFYHKLLKLKDDMNTETGKQMALKRHEYTEKYLQEFFAEWNGEK